MPETGTTHPMGRQDRLRHDERAIEGLPIRLVIALVVGVASLAVMMNTIQGLGALGVSELDARPSPDVVEPGTQTVNVTVVDSGGDTVANATVVAKSGSARLSRVTTAETGADGTVRLTVDPRLGPNRVEGTVELDVKPPSDSYADRRGNTDILVIEG
ncbi:MAG: hypothetical protein ACI9CA_000596 [Natronomonas sp.]|jgi:hypothetical protein